MLLQAGEGPIPGEHYVASAPDEVFWGVLPNRASTALLTVESGATVTFDTVSHEGILEDQGRDPVAFFGRHGVPAHEVLADAIALATSGRRHEATDGPHVVTGPVDVAGARPGDALVVEMLELEPRAEYGVVSNRHGRGCLAGEFPEGPMPAPHDRGAGNVHTFVRTEWRDGGRVGILGPAHFALAPFLGILGVAPDTEDPVHSVPPGRHGGNLDVKLLGVGSTLFLPVQVPGGHFYVGDPHFSQGDGEVALSAFEAPLRATLRLSRLPADEVVASFGSLDRPFVETPEHWVPLGLDVDLDEAAREATRAAVAFLAHRVGLSRADALAYLSATADLRISQVVDGVKGVHCTIAKADFA